MNGKFVRVLLVRALRSERLHFPKLPLLNRAAKEEGEPKVLDAALRMNGLEPHFAAICHRKDGPEPT